MAAPASTRTNDYVLLTVTAGHHGATGLTTSIAMQVSDAGTGPRVSAVGLGTWLGGAIDAQEGGGGPIRLSTTRAAGGVSAQLSGSVSTLSPQPYKAKLLADRLPPGQSLSLLVAFSSMRFPTLRVPSYTVTSGSVSLRLVQGIGTIIGRIGDPNDGGVAADAGPLGLGVQQHDFAARTGIAGAFMMGPTQFNSSSWTAPDGNTGRWANVGSVLVGWPAFAGPAGNWHLDWAGADATPWGNPVAFVYVPVGRYWPLFRCVHDCMYPAALP